MLELFKVSYLLDLEEDLSKARVSCEPGDLCKPDGCKPYQDPCPPFGG